MPDPICVDSFIRVTLADMHFSLYGHRPRRDDLAATAYRYQEAPSPVQTIPSDEEVSCRDF